MARIEFFSGFPYINYNDKVMKNITIRLDFIKSIKDNLSLFQHVQIMAGQRPEDIANIWYADPNLYWVILYINDIVDPYYDWFLPDDELMALVKNKYGVENVYATKWNVTIAGSDLPLGTPCNSGTPFSEPLTNFEYEQALNEKKRKIKVLKPAYLAQIQTEYFAELRGV